MPTGGQGSTGGAVPTPQMRGTYKRRLPLITAVPGGSASSTPSAVLPPLVVRPARNPRRGVVVFTRKLAPGSVNPSVFLPPPIVVRPSRRQRGGVVYLSSPLATTAAAPSTPGAVPRTQIRGWYKRRQPLITPVPYGVASPPPSPVLPPIIVRRVDGHPHGGRVVITRVPLAPPAVASTPVVPKPIVVRRDAYRNGSVFRSAIPTAPNRTLPRPIPPLVVRRDAQRNGVVYWSRKLQTPPVSVAGKPIPAIVAGLARTLNRGASWIGKLVKGVAGVAGNPIPPLVVLQRPSDRASIYRRNSGFVAGSAFQRLPPTPTGTPGYVLLLKDGPYAHLPNLRFREPGFTSDTFQLFIGNGTGDTFIGGASAVPAHSNSPGMPGMYASDGTYFYYCYSLNSWGRVAFGTSF